MARRDRPPVQHRFNGSQGSGAAKKKSSKKSGGGGYDDDLEDVCSRIEAALQPYGDGVHRLEPGAVLLDLALPEPLADVYRYFDGAELFHESLILRRSAEVSREGPDEEGCYHVGELDGDELFVDQSGQVWRLEQATGERLPEGSRFDRWLLGTVEAQELLYDREAEFRDDVFDEDSGDVVPVVAEAMHRRVLKRDRQAVAPRWRLARALAQQGKNEAARDELERVVEHRPDFGWAWFDLALISEEIGEREGAIDEFVAAAEARSGYEHAGFFWAHAARVAAALGDEARRADFARRALAADPGLVRSQREGAAATLEAGDAEAALRLGELAAALAPRDLTVLDLLARIRLAVEEARNAPPEAEAEELDGEELDEDEDYGDEDDEDADYGDEDGEDEDRKG